MADQRGSCATNVRPAELHDAFARLDHAVLLVQLAQPRDISYGGVHEPPGR